MNRPILKITGLSKTFRGGLRAAVHNFSLEVNRGEIVALLGESGCGKTTILRMIAGFEVPDHGTVELNGKEVVSPGRFVEPEKRGVGIVFQDYALFPHKTVEENIAFGLFRHERRAQRQISREGMALCGLQGLEKRYPHQLSGGQKQRVALARALAPQPGIILFDEPFSNIDTLRKNKMRQDIGTIIRNTGTTAIFVTHDTKDVLAIADRVSVLREGICLQTGTPAEVYRQPRNQYVAQFFGKTNLLKARSKAGGYDTPIGFIASADELNHISREVLLSIRPEHFEVSPEKKSGCFCGSIKSESFFGEYKELICEVSQKEGLSTEVVIYAPAHIKCHDNICYFRHRDGHEPGILEE